MKKSDDGGHPSRIKEDILNWLELNLWMVSIKPVITAYQNSEINTSDMINYINYYKEFEDIKLNGIMKQTVNMEGELDDKILADNGFYPEEFIPEFEKYLEALITEYNLKISNREEFSDSFSIILDKQYTLNRVLNIIRRYFTDIKKNA